jgi:hypothetical protein
MEPRYGGEVGGGGVLGPLGGLGGLSRLKAAFFAPISELFKHNFSNVFAAVGRDGEPRATGVNTTRMSRSFCFSSLLLNHVIRNIRFWGPSVAMSPFPAMMMRDDRRRPAPRF